MLNNQQIIKTKTFQTFIVIYFEMSIYYEELVMSNLIQTKELES